MGIGVQRIVHYLSAQMPTTTLRRYAIYCWMVTGLGYRLALSAGRLEPGFFRDQHFMEGLFRRRPKSRTETQAGDVHNVPTVFFTLKTAVKKRVLLAKL